MNIFYRKIFIISFILATVLVTAQEALVSDTEQYYDFLALQGMVERPYLNYRTLSDSVWTIDEEADHPWRDNNLGTRRNLSNHISLKIFGPELFNSYNTAAPYGQNDGALWQGKGYNGSLTGGARLEAYGVELTFKPQLAFSQNAEFGFITEIPYQGDTFKDKAAKYGYYGITSLDAPQRFGDEPFFTYDWGDSEIRYTWKTLTIGFGTQMIWLGPAQFNPIIHSNNAASYPKLDLGLRKQRIFIPKYNLYLGDIETRLWMGYLSESDWFDSESSNDHNLISGFSIAYGLPFLQGLTFGFNRIALTKWEANSFATIFSLFIPIVELGDVDEADQRMSIVIDYLIPVVDFDVYLEWARNDNSPNMGFIIRYPFHTQGYTLGLKKSVQLTRQLYGELVAEVTELESSRDYSHAIEWSSTFSAHHQITQGHTNGGQWLGAGIGTGGNSQYLGFKLYYPKGYGNLFIQRRNPDLDYSWFIDAARYPTGDKSMHNVEWNFRTFLDFGISGLYYITPPLSVSGSVVFRDEYNPLNKAVSITDHSSSHRYNVYSSIGIKYAF